MPRRTLHGRLLVMASASGALLGCSISAMNQTLDDVQREFALSSVYQGIVVSSLLVGALVGCLTAGSLTDCWGRRTMLGVAGAVGAVAALVCAMAPAAAVLAGGRFALGLSVGAASTVAPVMIGELASARARGSVVTVYQLVLTVGILVTFLLGLEQAAAHQWRWMFVLNAVPAVVLVVAVRLLPPAPGDLLARGRDGEALEVLRTGRPSAEADEEFASLRAVRDRPVERHAAWRAVMHREHRLPAAIAVGAGLMAALVGIGAVVYYSTLVFASAGVGGRLGAVIATLSLGVVNVAVTVAALWLIRRFGRRPLLSAGLAGMAGSLTVTAVFLMIGTGGVSGAVTVAAVIVYISCFAFSTGPLTWLIIAEILPSTIRAPVAGSAAAANWAANLLVALVFPIWAGTPASPQRIGTAFLFFAALAILFLVLIRRYMPETKDRPLAEVQALFHVDGGSGVAARQTGDDD
ncbi:sugar porter family MFS transporter [Streptomyces sp. 1222.5]|uniref:sugar porter family MFS transporter n=1 Tax=Streptomyces sp. 1222.5 TaxID=1881026 RepID=UPI003EBE0D48